MPEQQHVADEEQQEEEAAQATEAALMGMIVCYSLQMPEW